VVCEQKRIACVRDDSSKPLVRELQKSDVAETLTKFGQRAAHRIGKVDRIVRGFGLKDAKPLPPAIVILVVASQAGDLEAADCASKLVISSHAACLQQAASRARQVGLDHGSDDLVDQVLDRCAHPVTAVCVTL